MQHEQTKIHTSDAVSSLSSSSSSHELQGLSRTPTPTPTRRAPKNDPIGRFDGNLKNHILVHIPPTKNDKTPTKKCRVCARKKYQERNQISLCSVWCSSASRRLLHTISDAETLLKACSKFQVFISYSFHVIILLLKS